MNPRPWICCVEINHHNKAYYLNQFDGFERLDPLVVVWRDERDRNLPPTDELECEVLGEAWSPGGPVMSRLVRQIGRVAPRLATSNFSATRRLTQRLDELADSRPPSLIYAHTGFVAVKLARFAREHDIPLVAHFHGLDVTLTDRSYRRLLVGTLPSLAQIIVVGEWMVDEMVELGATRSKIHVVPMGIEIPESAIADEMADRRTDHFVTVGRLVACKGVDRVLHAFAHVRESHPNATLSIVGDGPEKPALESLAAHLDLGDSVSFTGAVSSAEALEQIRGAGVMVHHAVDEDGGPEAFGLVVTEAMAAGLPVIASRCGGLPDQVRDGVTGILVDQNDISATAEAMTGLIEDPLRARVLGEAGRARAAECFSSARLAREVEAVLSAVS